MEVITGSIEERIIHASFDILEKEGMNGATTKKIAQQANVSEVTLFRKFKNKQNLIETAKKYYYTNLLQKLEKIFDYEKDMEIEIYLKTCLDKTINLTENELNLIKIGMEEVRNIPIEDKIFPKINETITNKLTEFFTIKIKQNEIKNINPEILSLSIFSIIFEAMLLWKVYGKTPKYSIHKYSEDFLDIILNGIKSDV